MGAIWKNSESNENCLEAVYEWKVAGEKVHQFGTMYSIPMGSIYRTEEMAQFGHSDTFGLYHVNSVNTVVASIPNLLSNKYNLDCNRCFRFYGSEQDNFYLKAFAILDNNSISMKCTDFYLVLDKNGIDVVVPMFENEVNGERRYPTEEEAKRNIVLGKVYLLDDDETKHLTQG